MKIILFVGYLVLGLIAGLLNWLSLSMAIWGAPTHRVQYIGLLGALGLISAALISVFRPTFGRKVAIGSLALMATFWIPAIASVAPLRNTLWSFTYHLKVSAQFIPFFAASALALFYPSRTKWSWAAFLGLLLLAAGVLGAETYNLAVAGEYARPGIYFFHWVPGSTPLTSEDTDPRYKIDAESLRLLTEAGVKGKLKWTGASAFPEQKRKLIFLVASQIGSTYEAHFPRAETSLHIFDGKKWMKVPGSNDDYPLSVRLRPDGRWTMLEEPLKHGTQGYSAYGW